MKEERKQYILHLCSWYPSVDKPYYGDFIERHIQFIDFNYKQVVFALCKSKQEKKPLVLSDKKGRIVIRWFYIHRSFLSVSNKLKIYKKALKYLAREYGVPELIHVHVMYDVVFLAHLFHKKYGIPFIVTEHHSALLSTNKGIKNRIIREFVSFYGKYASFILPVSSFLGNSLKAIGFNQVQMPIFNIVPRYFHPPKTWNSQSPTRFIHVSSLEETSKNISGLLKAVDNIPEDINFEFVIVGNDHIDQTKKLISELKNKNKIQLKLNLSHEEVADEMRKADCFVLFSNYETLSCVLIEAISSGLLVIATKVGGVPEVVFDKELGQLIDKNDINQLTQTMIEFTKKTKLQNKNQIAEIAKSKFSIEEYQDKIRKLYHIFLN